MISNASLMPPNTLPSEANLEASMARVSYIPVPNALIWNPDTCPLSLLPWLAWALSVDTWNPDWSEAVKRNVIKSSFAVHKVKGTIGALEAAIAALGFKTEVLEWYLKTPQGAPYTFSVTALVEENLGSGVILDDAGQSALIAAIDAAKNVRSHFDFTIGAEHTNSLSLAATGQPAGRAIVSTQDTTGRTSGGDLGLATVQNQSGRMAASAQDIASRSIGGDMGLAAVHNQATRFKAFMKEANA